MKCTNCGTELPEGIKFCPDCGTPVTANEAAEEKREETAAEQEQATPV